ncbi:MULTISPECIES: sialidase family protein [unclassified Arenibacter]|uniref:sialidase family protein n=1 Tax=unclassified Arenibacter TaxID=2615047 RepID=UPI000E341472|nr:MULTISPECIES: sialidase family protein [unclassified Arenibacter]MCM4162974.1 glycosyl hydrolase [Arenibacter sp. A80]RFT57014.1 exo-alpha-sialidase [Arenibacter sp. P308M17]
MKNALLFTWVACTFLATTTMFSQVFGKLGHDLPIIDLDGENQLQVVVDREQGQYLGHPTTVLLKDGKTIICVYPKGHGKGGIVMKKSTDGGKTWSQRLKTPESWATSKEVPTIYPTTDAKGKDRLILFSGAQHRFDEAIRMSVSEDNGETWSELKAIGDYKGIVAMADCIPLKDAGHYLATFHTQGPENTMILYQVESWDGGLTWGEPKEMYRASSHHLCEAGLIYSPDKSEIAMLLRENARNYNSQIMFSSDEGKTWSKPKPMPGSLNGDRHQGIYMPDGRLLIQFRDNTPRNRPGNEMSPTEGDWVGWVGSWNDLKNGHEGQFRIRFKDNTKGWDSTYPAAELLADGTLVCTTYGHWNKEEQPYILSFRFKTDLLNHKLNGQRKNSLAKIQNIMK